VRLALRRARDAKGLSQGAVAAHMQWSISKVQRIESGDNAISATDLRALLSLYDVADPEEIDQLLEEARISRRQRWWTNPEYREHLTQAMMQLIQFEAEAVEIRSYQPVLVPGMFQTPAYAQFLLGAPVFELTDVQQKVRLDVRMRRRQQVIESGDGPHFYLVLDESVLKRVIGGLQVTADQFDLLADLAQRPGIRIRIVEYTEGAVLGSGGPFTLLDLGEDGFDGAVLYRESFTTDLIDHDPKQVRFHRTVFETLWAQALNEEKTIRSIAAAAAQLRTRHDRF